MKILSRYFSREFFKLFFLCQITFLVIYTFIDFLEKIDNFIEAEVSGVIMLSYFMNKIPFILVQMIPPATLISVILLFCMMKKNNEITAMKASGLNIFKISRPIFTVSLCIAISMFLFSEIVVPHTSARSNEIWNVEVEKQDQTRFYGNNQIWYRAENAIYWIKRFDDEKKSMIKPTFFFFDAAYRLKTRIDGKRGIWDRDRWKIEEGIIQEAQNDGSYQLKKFKEYILEIPETPQTFIRSEKSPEEMSYWQIKDYAKKVRLEGYDDNRYLVDMHLKVAFPLISLVLAFIGVPIALGLRKGGIPLAVSIGMGVCFLYMVILGLSRSLGLSGVLPPPLSAWMANLLFFLSGIYLIMNLER